MGWFDKLDDGGSGLTRREQNHIRLENQRNAQRRQEVIKAKANEARKQRQEKQRKADRDAQKVKAAHKKSGWWS